MFFTIVYGSIVIYLVSGIIRSRLKDVRFIWKKKVGKNLNIEKGGRGNKRMFYIFICEKNFFEKIY